MNAIVRSKNMFEQLDSANTHLCAIYLFTLDPDQPEDLMATTEQLHKLHKDYKANTRTAISAIFLLYLFSKETI